MNKLLSTLKISLLHKPRFGLVLSGGGAQGLAHIGVLKVLEEAGIRPDYLAGTSMGGVIAAAYAAGLTQEEIKNIATDISQTRKLMRLADISLPQHGIIRGERVLDFFDKHLRGSTFDNLKIPLTLIAVDLNTGQEVQLKKGSVAEALRATVSLPGVFAPIERDGMRLVDGGLLNNLPVDVVRQMGAEVVLAVDVDGRKDSPWRTISRLWPFSSTVGGLIVNLGDSLDVTIRQQRAYKLKDSPPDFLIQPKIPNKVTVLTGFNRVIEIAAEGEASTRSILPALEDMLRPHWHWTSNRKIKLSVKSPVKSSHSTIPAGKVQIGTNP